MSDNRDKRISDVVGQYLDPNVKFRASLLPLVRMQNDEVKLGLPSALVSMFESFMLPGHVMRGGSFTPEDVTDMAMNVGMMGAPVGVTTAPRGALAMGGAKQLSNNLPMDELSRLSRAKDMGFHTDLFHGTGSDITEFVPQRRGLYLTDQPEIANIYANSASKGSSTSVRAATADAGPNVMPLKLRGEVLEISDLGPDGSHGWSSDNLANALGVRLEDYAAGTRMRDMNNIARERGYSAIKVADMMDLGGIQSQWKLLDPTAVRSRFARFDPDQINSADILSMNPVTATIPGLFNLYNQNRETR